MPEKRKTEGVLAKRRSAMSIISEPDYTVLTDRGKAAAATRAVLAQQTTILPSSDRHHPTIQRQWFSSSGEPASVPYRIFPISGQTLPQSLREITREEDRWLKAGRLLDAPSYEDFAFYALAWAAARAVARRIIKRNPSAQLTKYLGPRYQMQEYAEVYRDYLLSTAEDDQRVLRMNDLGPDDDFGPLPVEAGGTR